jgi:hypothetical protein
MRTLSERPGGESIVVYPCLSGAFLIKHGAALTLLALRVNAKSTFPTLCLAAIRPAALKWNTGKNPIWNTHNMDRCNILSGRNWGFKGLVD